MQDSITSSDKESHSATVADHPAPAPTDSVEQPECKLTVKHLLSTNLYRVLYE